MGVAAMGTGAEATAMKVAAMETGVEAMGMKGAGAEVTAMEEAVEAMTVGVVAAGTKVRATAMMKAGGTRIRTSPEPPCHFREIDVYPERVFLV